MLRRSRQAVLHEKYNLRLGKPNCEDGKIEGGPVLAPWQKPSRRDGACWVLSSRKQALIAPKCTVELTSITGKETATVDQTFCWGLQPFDDEVQSSAISVKNATNYYRTPVVMFLNILHPELYLGLKLESGRVVLAFRTQFNYYEKYIYL